VIRILSRIGVKRQNAARHRHIAALLLATALAPAALSPLPVEGVWPGIVAAHARENITIDKIEIPNSIGKVVLNGIIATGSTLGRADLEALLKGGDIRTLADRLAKFDADRLAIKAFEWHLKNEFQETITVYENVEATGIRAGAIDKLVSSGAKQTGTIKIKDAKPDTTTLSMGRMSLEKADLTAFARWVTGSDPSGKAPMKQIHGAYEIASMEMKTNEAAFSIGRMTASGFKARLPKAPMIGIIDASILAAQNKDKSFTPETAKMFATILDAYQSFELGEGALDSMKVSGKDRATGAPFTLTIGKTNFSGGVKPYSTTNDIELKAADGFLTIKSLGFEGDFYVPILLGVEKAMSATAGTPNGPDEEAVKIMSEAFKGLIAKDIALKLQGVDGDFPAAKDSKTPDRVKLGLAAFEMKMGGFVGATPSNLDYTLNGFKMPIPANTTDKGLQNLRAIGLGVLELSARIKGTWDEAKSRFLIDDINADIARFGRVAFKGELGNVPRAFFENPMQNWVSLMGGNVQNLSVSIDNKGGFEALIAQTAKDQKKSPDQLKAEVAAIGPAMIGAFLAGHPDGQALSDAVTKFLRMPGSLSVLARASSPGGLTMMDFSSAAQNPAALLQKVRIEASAK
jgi:hypothetical protein